MEILRDTMRLSYHNADWTPVSGNRPANMRCDAGSPIPGGFRLADDPVLLLRGNSRASSTGHKSVEFHVVK